MRFLLPEIESWPGPRDQIALATVVQTWGSAPRTAGGKMAFSADGRVAGSVSGGCVEAAVITESREVLKTRRPRLLHFGVADETAWQVGLACGGTIDVFVEPLDPALEAALAEMPGDATAAVVTVVQGAEELLGRKVLLMGETPRLGPIGGGLDPLALAAARAAIRTGRSERVRLGEGPEAFVDVVRPAPLLVVVGGVHIAIALTALARTLGYRTVVVDPRPAFGNPDRFPSADRVVQGWPEEALGGIGLSSSTAVAVLTHDPKLDDPALRAALPSPAFYVGALGSKATQARRRERLLEAGLREDQLARLHAPIGLDLGGRSPEEIALSVMAEVVAARNGRLGA
jgi:xanthine dehydrogenase accessory factor